MPLIRRTVLKIEFTIYYTMTEELSKFNETKNSTCKSYVTNYY